MVEDKAKLTARVATVKKALPKKSVVPFFIYVYPEYKKHKALVTAVLQFRKIDEGVTSKLEAFVVFLKSQNKNAK